MDVVHTHCAGLDVHKKTVVACRITPDGQGGWRRETRTFGTMTAELLALADWLREAQVTHVAMESTGVYWRPVYNLLEEEFTVLVVNAMHLKHVPGRKSDVKDAEWIAQLLHYGLVRGSFIPPEPQRELRELVRYRTHLVQERAREVNRVHKVLEDANLKLSAVATDIMGQSARAMLEAIIAGQDDPQTLAQYAQGRMRAKVADLERALVGRVKNSHRLLLRLHLEHIDDLNAKIARLEAEIDRCLPPFDRDDLVARLCTIPGVNRRIATILIAEIGVDMRRFPTAAHLASWAGLAPGKHESAGRDRAARTRQANRYLRAALVEAAHAAGHTQDNYLAARYRRLAARRGKQRAAIAVARSILEIAYCIIQRGTAYIDLGADYFDKRDAQAVRQRLTRRLEALGFKVTLEPVRVAA